MFGSKGDKPLTVKFSDELQVTTIKKIAEGAFAYVFLAEDQNKKRYALKQITAQQPKETTKREIKIWQTLDHPNILKMVAHVDDQFILSELCDGSLVDFMQKFPNCKLAEPLVVNIMKQVCLGV